MVQPPSVCSSSSSYSGFFNEGLRAISQRGHRKTASLPCTLNLLSASKDKPRVLDIAGHSGSVSHPYAYAHCYDHDSEEDHPSQDNDDICIVPDETNYATASCPQSPLLGSYLPRSEGEGGMYSNSRSVLSWASGAAAGAEDAHEGVDPVLDDDWESVRAPESADSPPVGLGPSMRRRAPRSDIGAPCTRKKLANRASLLLSSIPHPSTGCISLTKSLRHLSSPLKKEIRPPLSSGPTEGCGRGGGSDSEKQRISSTQAVSVKLTLETYQRKLQKSDPFGSSPNSQSFFIDISNSTPNTPTATSASTRIPSPPPDHTDVKKESPPKARYSFLSFSSASSPAASLVSIPDSIDTAYVSRASIEAPYSQMRRPSYNISSSSSSSLTTSSTVTQARRRRLSFGPSRRPRSEPDTCRPHSAAFQFNPAQVTSLDPQLPAEHAFPTRGSGARSGGLLGRSNSARYRHSSLMGCATRRNTTQVSKSSIRPIPKMDTEKSVPELDWRQFHIALLGDELEV